MKTEQLKEWGLDERQIGMVMRENGRDIEAVKAKFAGYDALKQRAAQLEKTAASSEEVQQLRQQVRQWREKAEETEKAGSKGGRSVISRTSCDVLCIRQEPVAKRRCGHYCRSRNFP